MYISIRLSRRFQIIQHTSARSFWAHRDFIEPCATISSIGILISQLYQKTRNQSHSSCSSCCSTLTIRLTSANDAPREMRSVKNNAACELFVRANLRDRSQDSFERRVAVMTECEFKREPNYSDREIKKRSNGRMNDENAKRDNASNT